MEPTPGLVDEIYRQRVLRARRTPPQQKLLAGPRLFEYACRITAEGIRRRFRDAHDRRVQEILAGRLARRRRLEQAR